MMATLPYQCQNALQIFLFILYILCSLSLSLYQEQQTNQQQIAVVID